MTSVQKITVPKMNEVFKSSSTNCYCLPSIRTTQVRNKMQCLPTKRKRTSSPQSISKKCRNRDKPSWRLLLSFFDEDLRISMNFRCFYEESVFPATIGETLLVANCEDDDCRTEDNEIRLCSDYIVFQLELAILKAEINA